MPQAIISSQFCLKRLQRGTVADWRHGLNINTANQSKLGALRDLGERSPLDPRHLQLARAPTVIAPAPKPPASRALHFSQLEDLDILAQVSCYLYRKAHILQLHFRVYARGTGRFRVEQAYRLRWFLADVDRRFSPTRVW